MARINKSDIIQKAVNDLALSTSSDKIPTETLDKVQLTYDLNKKFSNFVIQAFSSTTGSLAITFPTIGANQEIYLTSLDLGIAKDATCDVATGSTAAKITPDASNISTTILQIPIITLTAQNWVSHIDLSYPLKLKPNVAGTIAGTFTVGTFCRSFSATGFITTSN